MARDLHDFVPAPAPEGLNLRGFRPTDATDVLEVNAAAFAHHPEQGSLDAAGLAARMAEPWFDPDGLILGHDADGLAGFHWTKRVNADTGEVYVMAVAPTGRTRATAEPCCTPASRTSEASESDEYCSTLMRPIR